MPNECVVTTTQHVKNIETLGNKQQDKQINQNLLRDKKNKAIWTREKPVTRSNSTKENVRSTKILSGDIGAGSVNLMRDTHPQNFGQAMRSTQK